MHRSSSCEKSSTNINIKAHIFYCPKLIFLKIILETARKSATLRLLENKD